MLFPVHFCPFTFVIFLIDAIKKVVSGDGNEYFPGLGAGLSLFIMLGGIFYVFYECAKLALSIPEC